ncbi:hypothetical protein [Gemmata sp.]|uniref:hypothetical protein n=1 Tax=Gemmata sp. TaxID=1914242 RepID=UPI003F6F0159
MPATTACAAARTVAFLSAPALWPAWPFLPVVRRAGGREDLGVVFDARAAGLTGRSATVYLTNVYDLPATWAAFLALPRETYDGADEVAAAGWAVD